MILYNTKYSYKGKEDFVYSQVRYKLIKEDVLHTVYENFEISYNSLQDSLWTLKNTVRSHCFWLKLWL